MSSSRPKRGCVLFALFIASALTSVGAGCQNGTRAGSDVPTEGCLLGDSLGAGGIVYVPLEDGRARILVPYEWEGRWPVAPAYDSRRKILYFIDAKRGAIMRLDGEDAEPTHLCVIWLDGQPGKMITNEPAWLLLNDDGTKLYYHLGSNLVGVSTETGEKTAVRVSDVSLWGGQRPAWIDKDELLILGVPNQFARLDVNTGIVSALRRDAGTMFALAADKRKVLLREGKDSYALYDFPSLGNRQPAAGLRDQYNASCWATVFVAEDWVAFRKQPAAMVCRGTYLINLTTGKSRKVTSHAFDQMTYLREIPFR